MNRSITDISRKFRRNSTPAENAFWQAVRNRIVHNLKFNRQYPITFSDGSKTAHFIADFYCHEYRLIVEIDGGIHEFQKEYDRLRTDILNTRGYNVIRFKNEQVLQDLNSVLEELKVVLTRIKQPLKKPRYDSPAKNK
ncbi:MAG: endonuclease domain-containing protein [Fidelibacterota bacterium]